MTILRTMVDIELPDEHVPGQRQQDVIAQRAHNAVHQVCLDGLQIPDEVVSSNEEPNYTVHIHSSQPGKYCEGCLAVGQDGRS